MCFMLCCHLEQKALWKIARSASNGNKNSQSTQPYPNTCPFQITKVRDLDFLQNYENMIYSLQITIVRNLWSKTEQ